MKVVEDTLSKDGIKRMLPRDFRALGYLQELNRIFLHPLGLALEIIVDTATNEEYFGCVWDYRDTDHGVIFGIKTDKKKASRIAAEKVKKSAARQSKFGWSVQPVGKLPVKGGRKNEENL